MKLYLCSVFYAILINRFVSGMNAVQLNSAAEYTRALVALIKDPSKYDKNIYPPTENNEPILLKVFVQLVDLRDISEMTMSFRVEIYLTQVWNDSRLMFDSNQFNSTEVISSQLHPDILDNLWRPDTVFLNVLDSRSPPKDDDSFTHKHYIGVNSLGMVMFNQRLSLVASCRLHLEHFPFDYQMCRLTFNSFGISDEFLHYAWDDNVPITQAYNFSLPDFNLVNFTHNTTFKSFGNVDANVYSQLHICFKFERRTRFYFLELYIPAIMVVLVAWLSSMKKETSFSDLLAVLLAMLFLYFSYITVMPRVSDVKAMDVFLIGCFLFIFIAMLQTFFIQGLIDQLAKTKVMTTITGFIQVDTDKEDSKPKVKKLQKKPMICSRAICKYITGRNCFIYALFPITFALFCFFYFLTYMKFLIEDSMIKNCGPNVD